MSVPATVSAAARKAALRPYRLLRRALRWALRLLMLAWGLVLLSWLLLHWAILPYIDDWRPAIERQASHILGVDVRIGQIEVRSGGWIPALELRDLRLLDKRQREVLRLPRVAAALSARSLLAFSPRFEQLLVDSPEMEVRRDRQGRIFVAGFDLQPDERAEAGNDLADWFFAQHEFVILKGRLRWVDEARQAEALQLTDLNLVVRNGLRRHELRLDATPPAEWGERFSIRARFNQSLLHRAGNLKHWSGQVFADLPRADVSQLRRHVSLPFELSAGDGALRAWIDIRNGQAERATVDMGLRQVQLRLASDAPELELARIEGRLTMARGGDLLTLSAQQLGFVANDGLSWPRSDWSVTLQQPGGLGLTVDASKLTGGALTAQRLDFALMAQIAERAPLSAGQREWLAELAPEGVISELSLSWQGELAAPSSYKARARVEGLSLRSRAAEAGLGRPGVTGVSAQIEASEKGGEAGFKMTDGELDLPGLFEEPILPLQKLAGTLDWRIEAQKDGKPPALRFNLANLQLANEDLRGEFDLQWRTGSGEGVGKGGRFPGHLKLTGKVDRAPATRVARYLPQVMDSHTRLYLRDALRSGEARGVSVRLNGDLAEFPFDAPKSTGQFRITTEARDVELAYVPSHPATAEAPAYLSPWPVMEQLNAQVVIDRGSLQIRNGRTRVMGFELTGVNGGIKDLMHHKPVLELEGGGRGSAEALLGFLRASPVAGWTGHGLDAATASGVAGLKLALQLPLADISHSTVKGQVLLGGNDLKLRPDVPLLANARARVDFDQKGVQITNGAARVAGGEAQFEGGSQADGSLRFSGSGVATAEGLRRTPELGLAAKLAPALQGQASYKLQLGLVQGHVELDLSSSLQGLAADLPAPLKKEADAQLPLLLRISMVDSKRDELRVELGNTLLQAHYLRDVSGDSAKVLRGSLAVQDSLGELPESGVRASANLGVVNLDAWNQAAQRLFSLQPGDAGGDAGGGYLPGSVSLRAQSLQVAGRSLNRVMAGVSLASDKQTWRATLDAQQLSGYVELRPARAPQPGTVFARLARLSLPKSEVDSVSQMLDQAPSSVPALDIVVDDFELRGKKLGRLEVQAQHQGPTREWRLDKLQIRHPDALLSATGTWALVAGQSQRRAQMDWKLEVSDAGQLLEKLGHGKLLRGGKGLLAGQIGWLGSPLSPDYPSMSGQLKMHLDEGQFLKAEPGVGRLLGVLSLQSLPRRFLLDFRDVFQEGFAFDGVEGDIDISRGVAHSRNLRMRGVQAVVAMEGEADLAAETQNLRVLVLPEVNAGGASLAYAAINPAVGLATFLAQLILRRPMMEAGTREFLVSGSWDDPKVEKVEKPEAKPAAPAASLPASGASK